MHLITILLIVVGLLTGLSGAIVFFGSFRSNRARSAWYFISALFAACWTLVIAISLPAKTAPENGISIPVNWSFVSAIMLDATFLGFCAWNKKYGKVATIIFLILGAAISSCIFINTKWMYSDVTLNSSGNGVVLAQGWLPLSYMLYFFAIVPVISFSLWRQYSHARSKRTRHINFFTMIAFGIASTITLVTNLVMPAFFDNWSASWLGPVSIATVILLIYYIVLRYRAINLSVRWLKIFSYIVIVASIAIVYMIIFSIIFAALFRGSTPSIEVIMLNFIMILIFIALFPAMNGLITFIRKLILEQQPHHRHAAKHETAKRSTSKESKKS